MNIKQIEQQKKILTDKEIIEIRKGVRTTATTNWADTLAFARAIEQKILEMTYNKEPK